MPSPPDSSDAGMPQTEAALVHEPAEPGLIAAPSDEPEPDWMDRICPYLLSEDGSYRSSQPDASHRCMAQDPPGSLPMAFQERFCLTERHVRCEMYKVAQSARAAVVGDEGLPADQVRTSRFRPSVRSVPLALGPSSAAAAPDAPSRRPIILAALAIGVIAVVIFLLVLLLGGGGSGGGTTGSPSPSVVVTPEPPSAPPATPQPTATTSAAVTSPGASSDPLAGLRRAEYVVQEGEALLAIAERFGVTRRQILLANPGMAESKPYTEPGQVIIVPVSGEVSEMLLAASPPPGFEGFGGFLE
jgi:hypothetical protein